MEKQPSSALLDRIRDIIDDPQDRALLDELAKAIRNSPLSAIVSDDAFIEAITEMQVGYTWPPKLPLKLPPTNDRKSRGSEILRFVIGLPDGKARRIATALVVKLFWGMLPHLPAPTGEIPPQYQYRQADGSHNNPDFPDVGKSQTAYATTVPVTPDMKVPTDRPDPGQIFDLLMARKGPFQPHVAGFSTMFFAHAALITHDLFNTDHRDSSINKASSYLDLAPLYGNNQAEQDLIRTFTNGEIKRDSFLDKRILGLPPVVSVMIIMYSRFHNYAAKTLAAINEGGRFTLPDASDVEGMKKRDQELFQVARLVTNGLYINTSVNDYIRAIFNVNQSNSDWALGPQNQLVLPPLGSFPARELPRGVGNHVSREFNLLYRFHSVQSENESKWTTELMEEMFPGKDVPNLTKEEFFMGLIGWMMSIPDDPLERTIGKLVRNPDGSYKDEDLVAILKGAIDDPAGNFGCNHIPEVLKALEIEGICQARDWNVVSLNEFRKFLNLTQLTTFEEINPDPVVAKNLSTLYKTPDDVELYPGLFAEAIRTRMDPASGICAPYTVSGAILGDAVSLIRGDRYLTTGYTSDILTKWGIEGIASDSKTLGGSTIFRLILNAFPDWIRFNSSYAMQPFFTSAETVRIFQKLETDNLYTFDSPSLIKPPTVLTAYAAAKQALTDETSFKVPDTGHLPTYMPDDPTVQAKQWRLIWNALESGGGVQQFTNFTELITLTLLDKWNTPVPNTTSYQVDIIKNIGNNVAIYFASVISYLPLDFEFVSGGTYSETDLLSIFTNLTEYSSYNFEPSETWALRREVADGMGKVTASVKQRVQDTVVPQSGSIGTGTPSPIQTFGTTFTANLLAAGTGVNVTSEILMGNASSVIGVLGLVFAQVIDFYLKPENKTYWDQIVQISATGKPEDDATISQYILEGARLTTTLMSVRNFEPVDGKPIVLVVDQAGTKVTLNKGDRVITNPAASRDPTAFPNPESVDLNRPADSYLNFGFGPRDRLGRTIAIVCLLKMVKTVANLKNLRRAPGDAGQLKLVTRPSGVQQYMTPDHSAFTSFPTTMTLYFDKKPAEAVVVRA